jgi:hypothetical protein
VRADVLNLIHTTSAGSLVPFVVVCARSVSDTRKIKHVPLPLPEPCPPDEKSTYALSTVD